MRLWHEALIPYLPRQQLLGLHREICALRGNGWGKKHSVVNYVFEHAFTNLVEYHWLVMAEMGKRGYKVNPDWFDASYRGKKCNPCFIGTALPTERDGYIYPEHNDAYLKECLENLEAKGIHIDMEKEND